MYDDPFKHLTVLQRLEIALAKAQSQNNYLWECHIRRAIEREHLRWKKRRH